MHSMSVSAACALLFTVLLAPTPTAAEIRLNNFQMRQTSDGNEPLWELRAETAAASGNNVDITDFTVRMRLENGTLAVIRSPHAVLNRDTRIIRSNAPITLVNDEFSLAGTGYDIFADDQRVFIRQDVVMTTTAAGLMQLDTAQATPDAVTEAERD